MTPEDLEGVVQDLRDQVAQLQGKVATYEAHGLNLLQGGTLQGHPLIYSTSVPTTTDLPADGMIRVIRTGGSDYLYARSNGAVRRVQIT